MEGDLTDMASHGPTLRRDAASGLVVLVPILISGLVLGWFYELVLALTLPGNVVPPGLQVFIALGGGVMTVLGIGVFMRTTSGHLLEARLDATMNRLPGLRIVYNASKTAIQSVFSDVDGLRTPVTIEMWHGARMTGFSTGRTTADGREFVFVPTAPNPTTGFVVEVDPAAISENDETVEDALARVLSGGFGGEDRTK